MTLPQSTIDRIKLDAETHCSHDINRDVSSYIAGAMAEAERAHKLVEVLAYYALEKDFGRAAREALAKYEESK
jgi:hypothetical protein